MKKVMVLALAGMVTVGLCGSTIAADKKAPAPAAPAAPAAAAAPAPEPVYKVGDAVPEFKLKNAITGEQVSFEKGIKGKAKHTIILFMNTGCSSCLAELMEVDAATKGNKDFVVYGIAVDKRGEEVVKAYYDQYRIEVNYLVDPEFKMPPMFGFEYTPAMIIVDKNGKIKEAKGGFNPNRDKGKIAEMLKKL
jgi:peroxiredoxin